MGEMCGGRGVGGGRRLARTVSTAEQPYQHAEAASVATTAAMAQWQPADLTPGRLADRLADRPRRRPARPRSVQRSTGERTGPRNGVGETRRDRGQRTHANLRPGSARSMQQTWTVLHHDGPNHLGSWLYAGCTASTTPRSCQRSTR